MRLLHAVQASKLGFKGRDARLQLLAAWHGLENKCMSAQELALQWPAA